MAARAAWMPPLNAAGGEGSTWLCKDVYRCGHAAARTVLTREGCCGDCAGKKKRAGRGAPRGREIPSRGQFERRGNLAPQPCRVRAALSGGEPGWRTTIGHKDVACRGIVGDGGTPRRNKVCRIAIECKCCKNALGVMQKALGNTLWGTSAAPAQSHDLIVEGARSGAGLVDRRARDAWPGLGCWVIGGKHAQAGGALWDVFGNAKISGGRRFCYLDGGTLRGRFGTCRRGSGFCATRNARQCARSLCPCCFCTNDTACKIAGATRTPRRCVLARHGGQGCRQRRLERLAQCV